MDNMKKHLLLALGYFLFAVIVIIIVAKFLN